MPGGSYCTTIYNSLSARLTKFVFLNDSSKSHLSLVRHGARFRSANGRQLLLRRAVARLGAVVG